MLARDLMIEAKELLLKAIQHEDGLVIFRGNANAPAGYNLDVGDGKTSFPIKDDLARQMYVQALRQLVKLGYIKRESSGAGLEGVYIVTVHGRKEAARLR